MTTKSVATRELQDGRWLSLVFRPYYAFDGELRFGIWDSIDPDDPDAVFWEIRMAYRYEVDGVAYPPMGGSHRRNMISYRHDRSEHCDPNPQGYCDCIPRGQRPVPHRYGEICEKCWLTGQSNYAQDIRGIGTAGCPHGQEGTSE